MSLDYLKVPTNEFVTLKANRTSSLADKFPRYHECTVSNLSLSTSRHSILKPANSSHLRQSISSHLNVRYAPIIDENPMNSITSPTTPINEPSPIFTNKSSRNQHRFFRNQQPLYKPTRPHPTLQIR